MHKAEEIHDRRHHIDDDSSSAAADPDLCDAGSSIPVHAREPHTHTHTLSLSLSHAHTHTTERARVSTVTEQGLLLS